MSSLVVVYTYWVSKDSTECYPIKALANMHSFSVIKINFLNRIKILIVILQPHQKPMSSLTCFRSCPWKIGWIFQFACISDMQNQLKIWLDNRKILRVKTFLINPIFTLSPIICCDLFIVVYVCLSTDTWLLTRLLPEL